MEEITKTLLIYRINVGNLPKSKAEEYMKKAAEKFMQGCTLPKYIKLFYIPDHNDTSFEVVNLCDTDTNISELEEIIGDEKEQLVNLRISKVEKSILLNKCKKSGFKNLSEYLRFVGLNASVGVKVSEDTNSSHIVKFAKTVISKYIHADAKDHILYPKIIEILEDPAKYKIIQGIRQSGKSLLLKILALYTAMYTPNKTVGIVSYSENASNAFMKDLHQIYTSLPEEMKPSVNIMNKSEIAFDNMSNILCNTCTPNAFRGVDIDMLLFDELAFFDDNKASEFWKCHMPCLAAKNGSIVIASTRKNRSKDNLFWNLWCGSDDSNSIQFEQHTISIKDVPNGKERSKVLKNILGDASFEAQYIIKNK